ncbi:MAG: class I SAM-dependent DNA methyltransferase [Christensenellales bacterium]|jgi:ubiquinone/menaquinone biosynthesis C-methylase UbiE
MRANSAYTSLAEVYDSLSLEEQSVWLRETPRILREEGILPPSSLADVACGTGRLTAALADRGYSVTGVDLSPEMLEQARRNAASARVRVPLVCQDMRELELPRRVSALLCMCDGLNYLQKGTDLRKALAGFHAALLPGGLLLADLSAPAKLLGMDGQFYGLEEEDVAYLWSNRYHPKAGCLSMDLTLFIREADGRFRRERELHRQYLHTPEELRVSFSCAGFSDIRLSDGWEDDPAGPDTQRIVLRARKPL